MKSILLATTFAAATATAVAAEPVKYTLDSSHSQVVFSYDHLGFSRTFGMFSGFEGEIMFDQAEPANSSVTVSMPVMSMFTGWEQRDGHFMSDDFFGATEEDMVTFTSPAIEVTGEDTALITGNLTMNDVTQRVVLEAKLKGAGMHPPAPNARSGFDSTTPL